MLSSECQHFLQYVIHLLHYILSWYDIHVIYYWPSTLEPNISNIIGQMDVENVQWLQYMVYGTHLFGGYLFGVISNRIKGSPLFLGKGTLPSKFTAQYRLSLGTDLSVISQSEYHNCMNRYRGLNKTKHVSQFDRMLLSVLLCR